MSHIEEIEKPLPLKYAIPILQGATLEEDNDLQDLWINLLVNAVANKKIEIKRVYMDILERLSPMEATILQQIYTFSFEENRHINFATDCLPECIYIYNGQKEKELKLKNDDIELALMNLARIGCIAPVRTIGGGELFTIINSRLLNQSAKITKTIISTNMDLKDIFSVYNERIGSRIVGNYNICRFFGDDLRLRK